jgi:hypothetical protein
MTSVQNNKSHGGILFPLEPFRPKILAAALAEGLIAKARNINDASLSLTRHPQAGLVIARITGSVVDDEGAFWRENADLAMYASQALPRQCFLYFVVPGPERRQGFMVAQRGQVIAADEGTDESMPPDSTEAEWPVARLAEQIHVKMDELESGFAGGPSVEISLMEPMGDEQELLLTLAGQPPDEEAAPTDTEANDTNATASDKPTAPERPTAEQDRKRREAEHREEQEARDALAKKVQSGLAFELDELGIVVTPQAELADADILAPYVVRELAGDPPEGVPREVADKLQGKRIDFAVKVEFLSEVFTEAGPLSKAAFEASALPRQLAGSEVMVMEVLAPRLSPGSLVQRGKARVFVSRRPDEVLPDELLDRLLVDQ